MLDLYINGVKRYSSDVRPGAFELGHLPVLTGSNNVTIVLTDLDGRERTVTLPFYMNTRLLGRGVSDFSFEAGAVRENFGIASGDYGQRFASGIWRRGLTDALTVEAHGEAARGLVMGGASAGVAVRDLFGVGGSLAVSRGPEGVNGTLWAIGFDRTTQRLSLSGRHEVASAGFRDIATLSGELHVRQRDTAAVGLNMGAAGTLNLAYVSETRADRRRTPVATASYGADLFGRRARLSGTAYSVLNQQGQWGVGVTLSAPLGRTGLLTGGVGHRSEGRYYEAEARGSAMDNRLTWQLRAVEGSTVARTAEARWDGSTIDGRVRLLDDDKTTAAQIEAAQSLVLFDGRLFVADRVDEAFAVVQVGRNAGVEVFRENQPVGRTDAGGRLFVNHLRAYESNGLSVDPAGLPLDAALETTTKTVAPRRGAGAPVAFGVVQERSALVSLVTKDGAMPPAGAEVHLGDRVFPLGYGGEVYLRGLEVGRNLIRVIWRERACDVVVTLPDELGAIPKLGPYTCVS